MLVSMQIEIEFHTLPYFQAQSMVFNIYKIENNIINGKAHYTSDDGKREIWYGECGLWMIGGPEDR